MTPETDMTDNTTKAMAKPSQILLFSLPRSGCHLLEKMVFSKQENWKWCWHPYSNNAPQLYQWMQKDDLGLPADEDREKYVEVSKAAGETWRRDLEEAEENNQTLYVHNHAAFLVSPERLVQVLTKPAAAPPQDPKHNWTHAPSSLLLHPGTLPIFTVRNATLTIPSNYRATGTLYKGNTTANRRENIHMFWQRSLYDWFVANEVQPVVVDADDYMTSESFVRHLTASIGLDPERAIVRWEKMSEEAKENMHRMLIQIQATLVGSEGIKPERAGRNLDLEAERRKWEEEFDADEVKMIRELVDVAMPEYEYLRERRLTCEQKVPMVDSRYCAGTLERAQHKWA